MSVSERTIRRRLLKAESNLRGFRPARTPQLLPQHRSARLSFAFDIVVFDRGSVNA